MIWLIGNRGMLGSEVEDLLKKRGEEYTATDKEVDITDLSALEEFCRNRAVSCIINCSAYTAVDRAEQEPEKAFSVNSVGVYNIVRMAVQKKASLIHISTDYVFNGEKKGEYLEEDEPSPLGIYGKSKLEGEKKVQSNLERYFIIRTAWLYGKNGNNFVYTILRLFNQENVIRVVNDQRGSPTFAADLAEGIMQVLNEGNGKWGIYHFSNLGKTTWFDFATEIYRLAKRFGLVKRDVEIVPIASKDFPAKAPRPSNSTLCTGKFEKTFSFTIRGWQEALEEFIKELSKCS